MPPKSDDREWHAQTLGNGNWEEILAPIDCSFYAVDGGSGTFDKASDPADSNTVWSGQWWSTIAPKVTSDPVRWPKGSRITYLRSSAALRLYFLR